MRKRTNIRSLLLGLLFLLIPVTDSWAVFNEKDLAQTLQVLRYELSKAYKEMTRNQITYEKQDEKQHEELIRLVNNCNELSLMLYSQKQDFTFDLTYALRQITDQYHSFTQKKMPYDNIIAYYDVEIGRFSRLVEALQAIPPAIGEQADSTQISLDALSLTYHVKMLPNESFSEEHDEDPDHAGHDHHHDHDGELEGLDFQLDSTSIADRDSCIFYSSKILKMFTDMRDHMVEDNDHYATTDKRLKDAYDYAQERYNMVQKKIFVEGQRNYLAVLLSFRQFSSKAIGDFKDKYSLDFNGESVKSEWRGPIVVGFAFIILIYLAFAALLSWLVIKGLKRRVKAFSTPGFADKEFAIILLAAMVLFVVIIVVAGVWTSVGTNFFRMASSLLVEYSFLLIAILVSMLLRYKGEEIVNGLWLYAPIMLLGLLVIAFRIMFIPNSVITLIFPPILLVFLLWHLRVFKNRSGGVPDVDRHIATASTVVLVLTFLVTVFGYVLLGLQMYIWWIFQLTTLQLIEAVKGLVQMYRVRTVEKKVRAYRMTHSVKVGDSEGAEIPVTWLYDLFTMAIIPLMILISIPLCLFLASRVFDVTQICTVAFVRPFLDTKFIRLSLSMVLLAVGLFYIFRYLEYLFRSLFRVYKVQDTVSKSGTGMVLENEVNLTLSNNVIWLLVWGLYVVLTIALLKIPTKSLSLVTAGLAAGIGFAMKDILNNFFYGVQLMSGRVRVGDTIECDGIRGVVDNISYQTTSIKAIDGSLIAFPNSTLFSKTFKNLTKNDAYEYVALPVGVAYGTDMEKARRVIQKALKPLCRPDQFGRQTVKPSYGIQITLSAFGDSSVDLLVKQYVLVEQRYSYIAKANEFIYKSFAENGIEIPFPQRDLHIKQDQLTDKTE